MIGFRYVLASAFGDHTGGIATGRAHAAPSASIPANRDLMSRRAKGDLALPAPRAQFVRARNKGSRGLKILARAYAVIRTRSQQPQDHARRSPLTLDP